MFFPISWISPFTVAMTIVPFFSCATPWLATYSLMASNPAFAASALINSCGRNIVPFSKPCPTRSSAGTRSSLMISMVPFFGLPVPSSSSSSFVARNAGSFKPLTMQSFRLMMPFSAVAAAPAAPPVPPATSLTTLICMAAYFSI